jgi:hypothetical protein
MHRSRLFLLPSLLATLLALWATAASAAEGSVSGPTMGYFFDQQQQALRPILGAPGASAIGDALALSAQLTRAEVAPTQQFALGVSAEGGLVWVDLRGPAPQSRPVALGLETVSRILISPGGRAAAVYDRGARRVQFLSGLPNAPVAAATVGLEELQGVLTAMAVGDDGETLLAATSSASADGGLYVIRAGGDVRRVSAAGRILSVSFLAGQDNAVAADYGRSEVLRIDGVSSAAATTVLASGRDGVDKPVAVEASPRLNQVVAALDGVGRLAVIPLNGGPARFVECNCQPRELTRMRGDSVFRLTSDARQPLFVLDAGRMGADGSTPAPRVLFIPAGVEQQSAPPAGNVPVRPRTAR